MRNVTNGGMAFAPARRAAGVNAVSGVRATAGDDEWVKTSVCMRRETRRRLKELSARRETPIQRLLDEALDAYLAGVTDSTER